MDFGKVDKDENMFFVVIFSLASDALFRQEADFFNQIPTHSGFVRGEFRVSDCWQKMIPKRTIIEPNRIQQEPKRNRI